VITVRRCDVRVRLPHPWSPVPPDALAEHVLPLVVDALIARLAARLDESRPVVPRLSVRVVAAAEAVAALDRQADLRRRRVPEGGRVLSPGLNLAVHSAVDAALYELYAQPFHELTTPAASDDQRVVEPNSFTDPATSFDDNARVVCLRTLRRSLRRDRLEELLRSVGALVLVRWATLIGVAGPGIPDDAAFGLPGDAPADGGSSAEPVRAGPLGRRSAPGVPTEAGAQGAASEEQVAAGTGTRAAAEPGAQAAAGPGAQAATQPEAQAGAGPEAQAATAAEPSAGAEQRSAGPPSAGAEGAVAGLDAERPFPPDTGPASPSTDGSARRATVVPTPQSSAEAGALDRAARADGSAVDVPAARPAEYAKTARARPGGHLRAAGLVDAELDAIRAAVASELRCHGPIAAALPPAATVPPLWSGDVRLTTVVPFLLLGSLQRIGVLDALAAILAAYGHPDGCAAFAAALARKTLPPPERGWHQPTEVDDTIAAVACRPRPPDGAESERLAATAPTWAPVLHRLLRDELAVERLVRVTGPHGVTLADADGVFPLAIDPDELTRLPVAEDRGPLQDFVAEMAERRASGRGDLAPGLDQPLDLIVGFALADVAWRLWHHLEPTHPLLALDRFADLDGRAEFTADRVVVRLPLGRRHADLLEHGLLDSVRDIPWFDGRPLELTGG
jgi:hypothetical protein